MRLIVAEKHPAVKSGVRLRSVALPAEHGGWSLLFEPILLGLLVAPSRAGLLVSVTAIAAFLARQPFRLAVTDWRRQRVTQRTKIAQRFVIAYVFVAILSLGLALRASGPAFLLPLLIAAPIVIIQLIYDSMWRSRALFAELAGATSTGSIATAIAICAGWPPPLALALWVIIAARSLPTILYIRARLRMLRQKPASKRIAIGAHILAVLVVSLFAWNGTAPWLSVLAIGMLMIRACAGLLSTRRTSPQRLGISELLIGVFTIAAVSIGFGFGW